MPEQLCRTTMHAVAPNPTFIWKDDTIKYSRNVHPRLYEVINLFHKEQTTVELMRFKGQLKYVKLTGGRCTEKREKVTVLHDELPVEIETLTHTFRQLVMAHAIDTLIYLALDILRVENLIITVFSLLDIPRHYC